MNRPSAPRLHEPAEPADVRGPSGEAVPLKTLALLPALQAAARPDAIAVEFEDQRVTYAELARRTRLASAQLWRAGVRAGDRVAWLGANHADQLTLLFALAHLGAALLPLNFRLAEAEWRGIVGDGSPALLLHDMHWRPQAQALGAATGVAVRPVDWLVDDAPLHAPGAHEPTAIDPVPLAARPEAAVLLVYTSGTTGAPRAAVHTQANLLANMAAARAVQELGPRDRVLTVLPLFHVGGLCIQTLPALLAGATVELQARFDADATFDAIEARRPTLTLQVPATMKALQAHARWAGADLTSLRAVWAGSSLLPAEAIDAFHARGIPVCNVYGATETGPFSIALGPADAMRHAGGCGWPAPGVQARLAAGHDGVGEVQLRGPAIVSRYWPDTPAQDREGWFSSGDLARQAEDGSYTIVGRAKDMIISGGENIYPAEIENLLARHPAVGDCAVVSLPDARWGEVAVAAVVPRHASSSGSVPGEREILEWLGESLARYKLPRRVIAVAELPRTALGKVQKSLLAVELQKRLR